LRIILAFDAVAIAVAEVDREEGGSPMRPAFRSTPEFDIGLEWGGRFVYWAYVRMTRPTWALSCIGMSQQQQWRLLRLGHPVMSAQGPD
jgi:hypothetical protein